MSRMRFCRIRKADAGSIARVPAPEIETLVCEGIRRHLAAWVTKRAMRPENRDALLTAIAKARGWVDDIRLGRIASFAEIAEREAQGERHIRLLAPLAFLSPRIIAAIVDGTAPADLTVTGLAKALPYSWAEQEERVGLSL